MMVFTSTEQEIVEQWGLYDAYAPAGWPSEFAL